MAYATGWLLRSVEPILGWSNVSIIIFAASVTLIYTMFGDFMGAVYSEIFQFILFLVPNLILIPVVIHKLGGLHQIYAEVEHNFGHSFFAATPP